MRDGGVLTIETAPAGAEVLLAVEDTGAGIDPEVRPHLFEPFFTTKDRGAAAGLSLASLHGLVTRSGGRIEVESEPGRGSRFSVFLPRAGGPGVLAEAQAQAGEQAGAVTVLLVEDDPLVRRFVEHVLSRGGHRLLVAGTAEEALALAAGHPGTIEVLLTDVVMPGMSGLDLAERLTRERPGLRVLYMSGHADEESLRLADAGPVAFLRKPFGPEALAARLAEALAGAPA